MSPGRSDHGEVPYYSLAQAADAEHIRLLRALEIPLEDIKAILAERDAGLRGRDWIATASASRGGLPGTSGASAGRAYAVIRMANPRVIVAAPMTSFVAVRRWMVQCATRFRLRRFATSASRAASGAMNITL